MEPGPVRRAAAALPPHATTAFMMVLVAAAVGAGMLLLLPTLLLLDWFTGARVILALTLILCLLAAPLVHAVASVASGRLRSPPVASGRLRSHAVSSPVALTLFLCYTSVVATARSFELGNIIAAQRNTLPYALKQPVAFGLFMLSCALLAAALPEGGRAARGARVLVLSAGAALATALFLAGGAGPALPPAAWWLLKTAGVAAVTALVLRGTRSFLTSSLPHFFTYAPIVALADLITTIWLTR